MTDGFFSFLATLSVRRWTTYISSIWSLCGGINTTAPMQVGKDIRHEIKQAIESVSSEIKKLRKEFEEK